jgi:hypothetical protein
MRKPCIETGIYSLKIRMVQLGHYMSLVRTRPSTLSNSLTQISQLWISRAVNLLVILPVIVNYFKPKTPITGASSPESIALELQFDKRLAQASLSVDALGNLLVAISPTSSQISFIAFSCLSSFTSGGNPALHSLGAVCLHALGYSSETGRLFGAIGVLNAIAHTISVGWHQSSRSSLTACVSTAYTLCRDLQHDCSDISQDRILRCRQFIDYCSHSARRNSGQG